MKIDITKLLRVAVQIAVAAPALATAIRPVVAELKPKANGS